MARENKDSGGLRGLVGAAFVVVALLGAPSSAMFAADAQSHAQRALSLFNRGSYSGAIAEYSKAISMEPSNAALFHNRGLAESKLDRYDAAFADFNKAISLEPGNAWLYNARGGISLIRQNLQGASEDFSKAQWLDPTKSVFYENLRRTLNAWNVVIARTTNNRFGAVAVSPSTLKYGTGSNWAAKALAEWGAMADCRKVANDCRVDRWISNQCIALATRVGGYSSGAGPTSQEASAEALRTCQVNGAVCQISFAGCSRPLLPPVQPQQVQQQQPPVQRSQTCQTTIQPPMFGGFGLPTEATTTCD